MLQEAQAGTPPAEDETYKKPKSVEGNFNDAR
jgi:hypothetical protein